MKMIRSNMNELSLEWSQHFSHYKSMGIFQDAQGQLTPQFLVESGPNSNLSEILWLSSLPVSMKKIRSNMKALFVAMETRVPIQSGPKLYTAFPLPNDALVIIWLRSAH